MNPPQGTPISADLLEAMNNARFETIRSLAQIAGEVMEMARSAEKSLYNINSTEAKILRSGMAGAALAAAEQLGQAVFQAVMKRVEGVVAGFVPRAEFDPVIERLQELLKPLDAIGRGLGVYVTRADFNDLVSRLEVLERADAMRTAASLRAVQSTGV